MIPDSQVIKEIVAGDRNAYKILVERYQQMVFRTCMGFLHNREDAEDLTQEVFIQAFDSLARFRQESSFSTWIYRIAVNASLNRVRSNKKNFLLNYLDGLFGSGKIMLQAFPSNDGENPEDLLIRDEQRKWVQKALDSLPENQRIAIVLSKYDDLSQREIAEIMNKTEGAVEALIHRAKANLRVSLIGGRKKITI